LKFTAEVESAVFISAFRLEVVTSFSGHRSRLSSAQRTLHLEVCDEVMHIYKLKQV